MSSTPDAPAAPSPGPTAPRPGLRERKKARTRESIRAAAMELFREQGYAATTVEQIAEAADVSPSTFFRYFPTKDALVVTDEFDPLLVACFQAQPAHLSVLEAFAAAYTETFGRLTPEQLQAQDDRMRLVAAHPPLRAAVLDGLAEATVLLAGLVAQRSGRAPDDPEVLALVGALIGVAMSVMAGAGHLDAAAQMDVFTLAIDRLASGFSL